MNENLYFTLKRCYDNIQLAYQLINPTKEQLDLDLTIKSAKARAKIINIRMDILEYLENNKLTKDENYVENIMNIAHKLEKCLEKFKKISFDSNFNILNQEKQACMEYWYRSMNRMAELEEILENIVYRYMFQYEKFNLEESRLSKNAKH